MVGAAMSVSDALRAARQAGVAIGLVRDDLVLTAAEKPPAAVLDLLSRNKAAILRLLRPDGEGWSADDWRDFYDEQAELAERDRGLTPNEANNHAFVLSLAEWISRNGSDPAAVDFVLQIVAVDPRDLIAGPTRDYDFHPAGSWDSRCELALLEAAKALDAFGIRFNPQFPDDFGKNGGG